MRNLTLTAALIATAGLAGGLAGGILIGSANADDSPASTHVRILRFDQHVDPKTNKDIDLGETGFTVGDQQVFRDPLMRDGHQIGTAQGFGEVTYLTDNQLGVTGVVTADLGEGTLALRFSAVEDLSTGPASTSVSAITGGTGSYAGATGQCTSTRIGDSDDSRIVCRVVLPR